MATLELKTGKRSYDVQTFKRKVTRPRDYLGIRNRGVGKFLLSFMRYLQLRTTSL